MVLPSEVSVVLVVASSVCHWQLFLLLAGISQVFYFVFFVLLTRVFRCAITFASFVRLYSQVLLLHCASFSQVVLPGSPFSHPLMLFPFSFIVCISIPSIVSAVLAMLGLVGAVARRLQIVSIQSDICGTALTKHLSMMYRGG